MTTKAQHERDVFLEFVEAAKLAVEPDSVQSEAPPRPDISCRIDGEVRFFELTRAADQEIANDVGRILAITAKTGEGQVGRVHTYDDRAILKGAVERKAAAAHETDGQKLDLLIYYDGVFHAGPPKGFIEASLRALQKQFSGRWHRIWLFNRSTREILGA